MESARLKVAGIAFTAVLAAVGVAAVIGGIGYGAFGEEGRIGPGFLPVLAGGLVAAFAVIDIIGRLLERRQHNYDAELALDTEAIDALQAEVDTEKATDVDIFGRTQKQRNRMLVAVTGILIVALLLVNVIGFLLAFGLMLFVIAVVIEKRKMLSSLIVTVAALAVAWLVFGVLLRVPLPQGLLGIL
ncbi:MULTISPECIES: tripartite tricarboxylate transporter TctB family protein [unclassified Salinibacterium]|uniref:tripartite tricarboxylate transporter TctB family protein n=1 Tax=unclassified Salinibacterium TaxID=2632331 RepID=UPI00141D8923|nr:MULTISPECIES: tripartite tricarboxylate transporter TctB family protein [unclassified Salinibacterium]